MWLPSDQYVLVVTHATAALHRPGCGPVTGTITHCLGEQDVQFPMQTQHKVLCPTAFITHVCTRCRF
jgi:hypothetical protein